MDIEKLKYPIGTFDCPSIITSEKLEGWISILEHFPHRLSSLVSNLSENQLNTPYRPDGWTARQTIHHIYDSHHNAYTRFKWALTEETPSIKAYDEKAWAETADAKSAPIELSLTAISALHGKWVYLIKSLSQEQLLKEFHHPARNRNYTLAETVGSYAWHSNHHYAHIENLLKREGWK